MKLTNWGRNLEDNRVAEDKPGWLFIALYIGICVEICKKSFKDLFFDLLSLLGGYACVARTLELNIKLGSAWGLEFTVGAGILAGPIVTAMSQPR
jgi:hypothetical protein